mgnify:CR=1 FL=1
MSTLRSIAHASLVALALAVTAIEAEFAPDRNRGLAEFAARAYALRFTEAELRETITFLRSPAGQKFMQQAPQASQEIVTGVDEMMRRIAPQVLQRIRIELRQRGHQI